MEKTLTKEELDKIGYQLYEQREQLTAQIQQVNQQIVLVRNQQMTLQKEIEQQLLKQEPKEIPKKNNKA